MNFKLAIQTLCDAGVEFIVVGGVCATLFGLTRITYDLDICYSRRKDNIRKLAAALAPFHPYPKEFPAGLPFVWDEVTLHNGSLFTLNTDLGGIDLLAEIAGVGVYEDALHRSIVTTAYERQIATLDVGSLIDSKRAAGRAKDLADVAELESIREAMRPLKPRPDE
jgi:hypothetical protein